MKPMCIYFAKDKYCVKGKYCEFSHDESANKKPCQNFAKASCTFGLACRFQHSSKPAAGAGRAPTIPKALVVRSSAASLLSPTPTESTSGQDGSEQSLSTNAQQHIKATSTSNSNHRPLNAWGFEDEEPIYFYGVPGQFSSPEVKPKYSDIARHDIGSGQSTQLESQIQSNSVNKAKQVCLFFQTTGCKFGSRCRHLHAVPVDSSVESQAILGEDRTRILCNDSAASEELDERLNPQVFNGPYSECGICISVPDDHMYGLLNNCSCVFCLKCIREWRRDGISVTHTTSQVRLCPLCRVESTLICPSLRQLVGAEKEEAFLAYKESLAIKKCMYFEEAGTCRFGSSCFYRHGDEIRGGMYASKDRTTNRVIVASNGVAEDLSVRVTTIADAFLRIQS